MKRLTQILTLFHTANCIDESNSDGRVIDDYERTTEDNAGGFVQVVPIASLSIKISSLKGLVTNTKYATQVFLPFDFSDNLPKTSINLLPSELLFFIKSKNADDLRLCGINFDYRILFVTPTVALAEYTLNNKKINCFPCGTNSLVSEDDLTQYLNADVTLDEIQKLIMQPLSTNTTLDLKITVGIDTIVITKDNDLKKLHTVLSKSIYKKTKVTFNRNSDNSLLKEFNSILIIENKFPADVIGFVKINTETLITNETDPIKYNDINNYIIHFPSFQSSIELIININKNNFNSSSKILFNTIEVDNLNIIDHPKIVDYKQISGTVSNYVLYQTKPKQVVIQNGTKKIIYTVNPINNYNPKTNKSIVVITK